MFKINSSYTLRVKHMFASTNFIISRASFWRVSTERKLRTLFCVSRNTRIHLLRIFTFWFKWKQRILVARVTQNSVRSLRSVDTLQNGATRMQRDTEEMNSLHTKVFSSLHNFQIEPLMAGRLLWWSLSYLSGPRQCSLLGSQWDSHKPHGFHPKYLKFCFRGRMKLVRVWNDTGASD